MFSIPPPLVPKSGTTSTSSPKDNIGFKTSLERPTELQFTTERKNANSTYLPTMEHNLAPIQNQTFIPEQQYPYLSNNTSYSPRPGFNDLTNSNQKRFRSGDGQLLSMNYHQGIKQEVSPNQTGMFNQTLEQNPNKPPSQNRNFPQSLGYHQNRNPNQSDSNKGMIHNMEPNSTHLHPHLMEPGQSRNSTEQTMFSNQETKPNPNLVPYRHSTPHHQILNQSNNHQSQQLLSNQMPNLMSNMKWNNNSLTPNSSWNAPPNYSPQGWEQPPVYNSEGNRTNPENHFYSQPPPVSPAPLDSNSYFPTDTLSFPMMTNPIPNFVYNSNLPSLNNFDPSLMKNMIIPRDNQQLLKKNSTELSHVLPVVMSGPRPYSPSTPGANSNSKANPALETAPAASSTSGPLCSNQKIRVPSHLLLTEDQKSCLVEISVVKRVFNMDDPESSHQFLAAHDLLPEQLTRPLNKWKTRNTRKRKHATTHLYQCCCGSDVKQFHGTKGTRRSKQKFPFVGCLAFVEVARRSEDGTLIWARGLLDHSPDCVKSQPFVSQ